MSLYPRSDSPLPANALLGLFDSGLGGLTVLRQLLQCRPGQPCLYVGDTARVPYGGRRPEEIRAIAAEVVGWLRGQGAQALVMACNTSNALALDVAQAEAGVPVVGLIDSLAQQLQAQRVGVLATPATAASGAYGKALRANRAGVEVLEVGCPLFVPAVERNELDSPQLRAAAADYLAPLLAARVEVIVLGCTHYPLLEPLLRSLLPAGMELVDPALAAMAVLETLLLPSDQPVAASPDLCRCRLVVTGDAADFAAGASHWLGQPAQVQQVNLRCPGGDL
ncbi:MAG: Glutamate racemase [Cyanobacteriota bacterium]|jgi:glutamate racemase